MARTSGKRSTANLHVYNSTGLYNLIDRSIEQLFYKSIGRKLNKASQRKIVTHGSWLAALVLLFILPQLLIFAKDGLFVGISGFFTAMFFNQASWVLMLVVLANSILLVQSLGEIAAKKRKGWNKIYTAFLINLGYVLIQLIQNITQPLPPIISLMAISFGLFVLFDIKKYYKKR